MRDSEESEREHDEPLHCAGCGYDLRATQRDAVCPECSMPVATTLERMDNMSEFAAPLSWLGFGNAIQIPGAYLFFVTLSNNASILGAIILALLPWWKLIGGIKLLRVLNRHASIMQTPRLMGRAAAFLAIAEAAALVLLVGVVLGFSFLIDTGWSIGLVIVPIVLLLNMMSSGELCQQLHVAASGSRPSHEISMDPIGRVQRISTALTVLLVILLSMLASQSMHVGPACFLGGAVFVCVLIAHFSTTIMLYGTASILASRRRAMS